jgi:hypothetical protein
MNPKKPPDSQAWDVVGEELGINKLKFDTVKFNEDRCEHEWVPAPELNKLIFSNQAQSNHHRCTKCMYIKLQIQLDTPLEYVEMDFEVK